MLEVYTFIESFIRTVDRSVKYNFFIAIQTYKIQKDSLC